MDKSINVVEQGPITAIEWDFILPEVTIEDDDDGFMADGGNSEDFSIGRLISGLQNGLTNAKLQQYLSYYDEELIAKNINATVHQFPAIFYAIATNDISIVRTCVKFGGNVNAIGGLCKFSLLASQFSTQLKLGTTPPL